MSKGKAEIRQRIKNGISESTNNDRIRIRRSKKKESNLLLEHYKQYLAIASIIFFIIGVFGYFGYRYYIYYKINLVHQPLSKEKIIQSNMLEKSLFWGTYRPHLYFGLKHRSPASLLGGLMWFNQLGKQQLPNIRYSCNPDDKLTSFNWEMHDLRNFARQRIVDSRQTITTSFVKRGENWIARVEVNAKPNAITGLMWYFHLPDAVKGYVRPVIDQDNLVGLQGSTIELGDFKISFHDRLAGGNRNRSRKSFLVSHVQRDDKILQTVESGMGFDENTRQLRLVGYMPLPRTLTENIWVYEITSDGDFVVDIIFESANEKSNDRLTTDTFQRYFDKYTDRFHEKFNSLFRIERNGLFSEKQIELAKTALSNLIGGIGYFHGSSIVRSQWSSDERQPLLYWPNGLFTATPSRTQFPRGFLWDEGFHCLLLARWDPQATFEIIGHWLDLLNAEGWIPREQILGWEARAKVPEEFVIQDNRNGNPPTLLLSLEDFDERFDSLDHETQTIFKNFLIKAIPRLETWYQWFNSSQLGQGFGNYQWKGRNANNPNHLNPLTLSSGFDDYPRTSHPSEEERHVDLRCWMAMFSRVLAKLKHRINTNAEPYLEWSKILNNEKLLNEAHWDEENNAYSDYGQHTEAVSLIKPQPVEPQHPHQNVRQMKIRKVFQPPKTSFVPHFGYVNLFPMLMKILSPSSPKLGIMLNNLDNPNLLWTKFGLRSLARNSSFYQRHNSEDDPPYWRGAIWININYLTIRSLAHYSKLSGPYQNRSRELYHSLMVNVVSNVLKQLKQTGYMWEQYDDVTGKGQRAHPFAGWTSLVVMSMAQL